MIRLFAISALLVLGTLAGRAQIASESFSPPPSGGTTAVVMANTPSGEGDPDTIVCRAPQRIADSDGFGPTACGHNYEWERLTLNGKDLAPDGKTLIDTPTVDDPKGDGDPDAVTCRTPKFVIRGPRIEVCLTNRSWADLRKNHQIVDARGAIVTRRSNAGGLIMGPFQDNNSWSAPGGGFHDSGQPAQSSATP